MTPAFARACFSGSCSGLEPVSLDPFAPFPRKFANALRPGLVVIGHDIEAGRDQSEANELDALASDRPQLSRQKAHLGSPPGLSLREDDHAVRPSQRRELGESHMLRAEPGSLNAVVGIEKNEIGVAHRRDQLIAPLPAKHQRPRNLGSVEDRVRQQPAGFERCHASRSPEAW